MESPSARSTAAQAMGEPSTMAGMSEPGVVELLRCYLDACRTLADLEAAILHGTAPVALLPLEAIALARLAEDGPQPLHVLAKRLGVDPQSVTELAGRLSRAGRSSPSSATASPLTTRRPPSLTEGWTGLSGACRIGRPATASRGCLPPRRGRGGTVAA
jgi:hypothetical protein